MGLLDILQLAGTAIVLVAFVLQQTGRLKVGTPLHSALNLIGALWLGVLALITHQWGFLILNLTWGSVAFWTLIRPRDTKRSPKSSIQ